MTPISEGEMLAYLKGDRCFGRFRDRLVDNINECHHEIGGERESGLFGCEWGPFRGTFYHGNNVLGP